MSQTLVLLKIHRQKMDTQNDTEDTTDVSELLTDCREDLQQPLNGSRLYIFKSRRRIWFGHTHVTKQNETPAPRPPALRYHSPF